MASRRAFVPIDTCTPHGDWIDEKRYNQQHVGDARKVLCGNWLEEQVLEADLLRHGMSLEVIREKDDGHYAGGFTSTPYLVADAANPQARYMETTYRRDFAAKTGAGRANYSAATMVDSLRPADGAALASTGPTAAARRGSSTEDICTTILRTPDALPAAARGLGVRSRAILQQTMQTASREVLNDWAEQQRRTTSGRSRERRRPAAPGGGLATSHPHAVTTATATTSASIGHHGALTLPPLELSDDFLASTQGLGKASTLEKQCAEEDVYCTTYKVAHGLNLSKMTPGEDGEVVVPQQYYKEAPKVIDSLQNDYLCDDAITLYTGNPTTGATMVVHGKTPHPDTQALARSIATTVLTGGDNDSEAPRVMQSRSHFGRHTYFTDPKYNL